jgi:glycosyltransferase involved in cell wall biosynthesis
LNSWFADLSVKTLWLRLFRQIPERPLVLAPRGEFSVGALGLKPLKKSAYLWLAHRVNLYKGLVWQASSAFEAADIQRQMTRPDLMVKIAPPVVRIATDLLNSADLAPKAAFSGPKQPGQLRIVFLSRLVRMKNLDLALQLLAKLSGQIQFDIYGPQEDADYWQECVQLIDKLPANVQARYCGQVLPNQVMQVFAQYHLFLFPTRGENFGYVILEALLAGCPVLISDQTMWHGLEQAGVGWDLPLTQPEQFRAAVQRCLAMDEAEFKAWSARARDYATNYARAQAQTARVAYQYLFQRILNP